MTTYTAAQVYARMATSTTMPKGKYESGIVFPGGLTFEDGCVFGNVSFGSKCRVGNDTVIEGKVTANGTKFGDNLVVKDKATLDGCYVAQGSTFTVLVATNTRMCTESSKATTIQATSATLTDCRIGRSDRGRKISFKAIKIKTFNTTFNVNVEAQVFDDVGSTFNADVKCHLFTGNGSFLAYATALNVERTIQLTGEDVRIPSDSVLNDLIVTAHSLQIGKYTVIHRARFYCRTVNVYSGVKITNNGYTFKSFDNVVHAYFKGPAEIDGYAVTKMEMVHNIGSSGRTTKMAITDKGPIIATGCFTGTPAELLSAAKKDRTTFWSSKVEPYSQKDADYAYVAARIKRMAKEND